MLSFAGCAAGSYQKLKQATDEGPVKLWRELKIKLGERVLHFDERLLIPSNFSPLRGYEVD